MDETASGISAEASTTAGVLPAPTPIAGLPEEYAALTMPGPPVAKIVSASLITAPERATLGSSIQPMISSGAPALTAASSTTFAASIVHFSRGDAGK